MAVNGYKFTALTGGGAGALDAQDGSGLGEGDIAIVMASGILYLYQLSASSGATESSPDVIAPDTNAGTKRWLIQRVPQTNSLPVGTVIQWIGGYFTNSSNGGFTSVLGNTVAAFNALHNADGIYAMDGAALNLPGSPIYNGAGRYLPNATDSRFIMGAAAAGTAGGNNSNTHTHTIAHTHTTSSFTLAINEMPNHNHYVTVADASGGSNYIELYGSSNARANYSSYVGGGAAHNHGSTGASSAVDSGAASATENRPQFLSVIYGIKVI